MKRILTAALLAAATTLAACSSDTKTGEQGTATTNTTDEQPTTTAATDTTLSDEKIDLMQTIAQHGMLQVELGNLAAANATTDATKQYAQDMVQTYTNKQKELQKMAQTYQVELDTTLKDDYRKYAEDLKGKKAADVDKTYWKNVSDAQKETLDKYESVLKNITEADATAFGIWARTSEKELRAQYEQGLAQQQQLKNGM
ncbi:MAG TPA: DUF4142 domain-containing protein [Pontibacter sp.]